LERRHDGDDGFKEMATATIYSTQMSGAWRDRCAKEEKQLLYQLAPHLYANPNGEQAPAHHSAPWACDAQPAPRRAPPQAPPSARPPTGASQSSRKSSRNSKTRNTTRQSGMVSQMSRPDTASTSYTMRSSQADVPNNIDLQRKLAMLEAQVMNEQDARRKMENQVKDLRSQVDSQGSRCSTSRSSRPGTTKTASRRSIIDCSPRLSMAGA